MKRNFGMRINPVTAAAALSIVIGACSGSNVSERAIEPQRVVLPASEARRLLGACDGYHVAYDSTWTPAAAQLRAFENRLSARLRSSRVGRRYTDASQFYSIQYLGFTRNGRYLIFANGVGHIELEDDVLRLTNNGLEPGRASDSVAGAFAKTTMAGCDGGEMFFRAEYDIASDSLIRFAFQ